MLLRESTRVNRPTGSRRRSSTTVGNDGAREKCTSCMQSWCKLSPKTIFCVVVMLWVLMALSIGYRMLSSSTSSNKPPNVRKNPIQVANIIHPNLDANKLKQDSQQPDSDKIIANLEIVNPTVKPTEKPTNKPTVSPTMKPTLKPTDKPTNKPTKLYYVSKLSSEEAHDRDKVLSIIEYWKPGTNVHVSKNMPLRQSNGKYLTFWTDCGGFNNIRMAFEYFIMVAWITNRTLVLPPVHAWYLIDYGRLARMKTDKRGGTTKYSDFFNFNDLQMEVPVISTNQFIREINEKVNDPTNSASSVIHLPSKFTANANNDEFDGGLINEWKTFLDGIADQHKYDMAWGPLGYILYWPSISEVQSKRGDPPTMFRSNRENIEYNDREKQLKWIHFPSCTKGDPGTSHDYRYLGQVATFIWFAEREKDKEMKRVIRDHIHMRNEIFELASNVIAKLGIFKYAAMHIRRNELQYKNSFISASDTLKHVRPLLIPNETIYIATDETDENFFKVIEEEFHVLKWNDFFVDKSSKHYIGDQVSIPRKWEGCVEMVICGAGRIFFGTDTSTFTAYITRLRGYFNAPDRNTYHHNEQWTGNPEVDGQRHRNLWGQTYMDEFPDMWESIFGTF